MPQKISVQSYRQLRVWQMGMDLVTEVYRVTALLPSTERFGLTAQARTAAVSVPANIAEGHGRAHRAEYRHHVSIARASALEVETLLDIAERVGFLPNGELTTARGLCDQLSRMLLTLNRALV